MFVEPLNYAKLKSLEFQPKCSLASGEDIAEEESIQMQD